MTLEDKYLSGYILLTDQVSMSDYLYFLRHFESETEAEVRKATYMKKKLKKKKTTYERKKTVTEREGEATF